MICTGTGQGIHAKGFNSGNTNEEVRGHADKATSLTCINDYPEITLLQKHRQDRS